MEQIVINSGLNSFCMPDKITDIDAQSISIKKKLVKTEPYLCIETAAQAASIHVKWLNRFNLHSFLLKIDFFDLPVSKSQKILNGNLFIKLNLQAQSRSAFSYNLTSLPSSDYEAKGGLVIGTQKFNETFKRNEISVHWKETFKCLTQD